MNVTLRGLLLLALGLGAAPAEGQLLGRIVDRARQRVRETVEQGVDRTVDGVADAVEQGAGRPAATPASTPAVPAAPRPPAAAPDPATPALAPQDPVARGAALETGFRDADLGWLRPLIGAHLADVRREAVRTVAGAQAVQETMRGGAAEPEDVLESLRRETRWVLLPPAARYDAACTAVKRGELMGATRQAYVTLGEAASPGLERAAADHARGGGAAPTAAERNAMAGALEFPPAYRRAIEWYQGQERTHGRAGLSLSYNGHYARVLTPEPWLTIEVHARNDLAATRSGCRGFPSGPMIVVTDTRGMDGVARQAADAAVAGTAAQLPAALQRAQLSAEDWDRMQSAILSAAGDGRASETIPGFLDALQGSPQEVARRRANATWFLRNRALIEGYETALLSSTTSR